MEKENRIFVLVFCLTLFAVVIAGLSFAFIKKAEITNTVAVNGSVDSTVPHTWTFSDQSDTEVELSLLASDFSQDAIGNYSSYTFTNSIKLNRTKKSMSCTYDIVYKVIDKYTPTVQDTLEYTIQGRTTSGQVLNERNIPSSGSGTTGVLDTFTISAGNTQVWTFEIRFYNINANQEAVYYSNPKGSIYFVERHCGD